METGGRRGCRAAYAGPATWPRKQACRVASRGRGSARSLPRPPTEDSKPCGAGPAGSVGAFRSTRITASPTVGSDRPISRRRCGSGSNRAGLNPLLFGNPSLSVLLGFRLLRRYDSIFRGFGPTRNFTTFLAAILMASPVAGLRPIRALRSTRTSRPMPGRTNTPFFLTSLMAVSDRAASKLCETFLVTSHFSANAWTISDCVICSPFRPVPMRP